jgi:cholinesterase
MNIKRTAAIVGMIGGITAGSEAATADFQKLVVFGDSLSDSGNAGRFSNGPVWVELLAKRLGLSLAPVRFGGTNLAVGGARAAGNGLFDLAAQTAFFLARGEADPKALYVIYAGGNDLRSGENPARAAQAVAASVEQLAAAGARHFLVPNLGDLGVTPDYRERGAAAHGRDQTRAFNAALDKALGRLERRDALHLHRLDVFALSEVAEVGFVDSIHPDAAAHAQLADAAYNVLTR